MSEFTDQIAAGTVEGLTALRSMLAESIERVAPYEQSALALRLVQVIEALDKLEVDPDAETAVYDIAAARAARRTAAHPTGRTGQGQG